MISSRFSLGRFGKQSVALLGLLAVPLLTGAESKGCGGGNVVIGGDACVVTGCSGEVCADQDQASICIWSPTFECYSLYGSCARQADGACGWTPTEDLQKCLEDKGSCDPSLVCDQAITCVDGQLYPTGCGPDNCDEPIGPCDATCDPTLACGEAITCHDGLLYPTTCGPANCDEPIGPCEPECDPTLVCTQAETCSADGLLYPTGCGPANCDEPIGPCEPECDPTLLCGDAITCVNGLLYPTTCGPANCDAPSGECDVAQCQAYPVCEEGFHEVPACTDQAPCHSVSICGYTIFCQQDV
jgi:hypothetical protein